jgi:hypothetical protein
MNDFKLTFTLKQHTPIIHFQHDQYGATLRASEVKPKLDKFILTKMGKETLLEEVNEDKLYLEGQKIAKVKKWLVGSGEHPALDYKLIIKAYDREREYDNIIDVSVINEKNRKTYIYEDKIIYNNLPNFFGNMMKLEEFKSGDKSVKKITFYKTIEVSFISINPDISKTIKQNFGNFLAQNNFGSRQGKGFGSFYVHPVDNNYTNLKSKYCFKIEDNNGNNFKKLFETIELFYKTLKSGINIKTKDSDKNIVDKIYFKSLMFKYAKNLDIPEQWDKRTIRHSLYLNDWKYKNDGQKTGVFYNRKDKDGTVHYNVDKENPYFDFRDLLGLSTEQDWLFYKDKHIKKEVVKKENEINDFKIERFQSPIVFKPIYDSKNKFWNVHLFIKEIPEKYKGSIVHVSNSSKSIDLIIYPNFNVFNYIEFAIENYNSKEIIYGIGFNENNCSEIKTLNIVFEQLKKQLKDKQS